MSVLNFVLNSLEVMSLLLLSYVSSTENFGKLLSRYVLEGAQKLVTYFVKRNYYICIVFQDYRSNR